MEGIPNHHLYRCNITIYYYNTNKELKDSGTYGTDGTHKIPESENEKL